MEKVGPPADLVATYAIPLPGLLLCELLGVPFEDRDPFPDPDRLDVTRNAKGHLAFGHGPHHRVGAQLARMDLRVGVAAVPARFPRLRLADEVRWRAGLAMRGPLAMPVAW